MHGNCAGKENRGVKRIELQERRIESLCQSLNHWGQAIEEMLDIYSGQLYYRPLGP
jgi:hypothetical protein